MKRTGVGMDDFDAQALISKLKVGDKAALEQLLGLKVIKVGIDWISKFKARKKIYCSHDADADRLQQEMLKRLADALAAGPGLSPKAWNRLLHNLLLSQKTKTTIYAGAESDQAGDDSDVQEELVEPKADFIESWSALPANMQLILRAWVFGECHDDTLSVQLTPEFTPEELEAALKRLQSLLTSKKLR